MPRYRHTAPVFPEADREALVAELARELNAPAEYPLRQPLIYEEPIPQTDTRHVVVIWERWNTVPVEERASIIMDAYEQAEPAAVPQITIAMGATVEEAIDLNLLPYEIVTTRREGDTVSQHQLHEAMKQEGAVATPYGLRLRLPTREMAEAVHRRLQEKISGPYWAIQKTEAAIVD